MAALLLFQENSSWMEANNKQAGERNDFTLRPIARNLSDEEVLDLYHSGVAIYVEQSEEEEVTLMMLKAITRTLRCKHIAKGKSENDVRTYYKKIFGGANRMEALERMRDASRRKQFICEHVGNLMAMGVIFGKTKDIALGLGYTSINVESIMRYIRLGKQKK